MIILLKQLFDRFNIMAFSIVGIWDKISDIAKFYKTIVFYQTSLLLLCQISFSAKADDDFKSFQWMTSSFKGLESLFSLCLEPTPNVGFNISSQTLNLSDQGKWVATGSKVKSGKLIRFDWSTKGIEALSRKYLILYRIDPRFPVPQVYVQSYDYLKKKYISDFHQFKKGNLANYQAKPYINWNERITDYNNYFNFVGRNEIPVNTGDVINITLARSQDFFPSNSDFTSELDDSFSGPSLNYTATTLPDNKIIYSSASTWCNSLKSVSTYSSLVCNDGKYKNSSTSKASIVGKVSEPKFNTILPALQSCSAGSNTKDLTDLCYYDNGRGMKILIGSQPVKEVDTEFIYSSFLNKNFFYHKAESAGSLKLATDWDINGMFVNFSQSMSSWTAYADLDAFIEEINSSTLDLNMNFLHFGRYLLTAEIGNGDKTISFSEEEAVKLEYTISNTAPDDNFVGTNVSKNFRIDAASDGYLWLRVINPNTQVQGIITVNYANYTGSAVMSDIIYNKIIIPLRKQFNYLTELFYKKLTTDPVLKRIAKLMLTLYIIFYGLYFLSGATKITVSDIVTRVIKVGIIVALFSETSWTFFNQNLFQFFVNGTDYIMTNVVDATSSTSNVFGFIDPVFDKYTNGRIWGLLFIELLQIQNGLTFLALMTIYSIIIFFRSVLEVVIGYVLAFIGLAVMISLAPFFIILMLFEQTKSIFDNWLSTLFDYTIQPTILLVFFLLIDQMIGEQLTGSVLKACWGCMIPLKFGFDLNHLGIPLDFSFTLPFLQCIPFFVSVITEPSIGTLFDYNGSFLDIATSASLFYAYCLMANGLVEYMTVITAQLTNVTPARQEGKVQRQGNATSSVVDDIKSITTDPITLAAGVIKDKTIGQNYQTQARTDANTQDYSRNISDGSRLDAEQNPQTGSSKGQSDKDKGGKGV